jgi:hypothetical protein
LERSTVDLGFGDGIHDLVVRAEERWVAVCAFMRIDATLRL